MGSVRVVSEVGSAPAGRGVAGSIAASVMACGVLLAVAVVWQMPLRRAGWFGDDPAHLAYAVRFSPAEMITKPRVVREQSPGFLTPLLGVSVWVDWRFAGLDTRVANVHSLLALWLVGCAALALGRAAGASWPRAALAAGVLASAPPVVSVASWMSTRHYLEGLGASLVAVALVLRWRERGGGWRVAAAVALTALAALSKEVFVVVPLVAVLAAIGLPRRRTLVLGVAFLPLLPAYLLYRGWALGSLVGGYEGALPAPLALATGAARRAPEVLAAAFAGAPLAAEAFWPTLAFGVVLLAVGAAAAARKRGWPGLAAFGALAALAVAPVLPVLARIAPGELVAEAPAARLVLVLGAALWLAAAVPLAASRTRSSLVALVAVLLATLPGAARTVATWRTLRAQSGSQFEFVREHWREERSVVIVSGVGGFRSGTQLLLALRQPGPSLRLLAPQPVLREEIEGIEPERLWLLPGDLKARPRRTAAEAAAVIAAHARVLAAEDPELPLSVRAEWDGSEYRWELGPPSVEFWHRAPSNAAGQPIEEFRAVPARGSVDRLWLVQRGVDTIEVRVRAVSSDGRYRDSPLLRLDLDTPAVVEWPGSSAGSTRGGSCPPPSPRRGNG